MLLFFISIAVILGLIIIGVPIGFAFISAALIYGYVSGSDVTYSAQHAFQELNSFALLALPLFVLSGMLMGTSGITKRLLNFIEIFIGKSKSGLGALTVLTCMVFGAVSGSAAAAIAAIGTVLIPRMNEAGYPKGYATGLIAVSSVLALLIPPSIPMIVFAIAIRQPISEVFLATLLPGVILAGFYLILNYWFLRKEPIQPSKAIVHDMPLPKMAVKSFGTNFFALLTPVVVLGTIYSGIATPEEAGAIAFAYTLIVGFLIYREMSLKNLVRDTLDATWLTGTIVFVMFSIFVLSRGMVLNQVPQVIADSILTLTENKYLLLIGVNVLLLFIGMIMDDISGGLIVAVLLTPLMRELGIDPLHFAAIVGVNLGMGNITPPVAPLLYIAGGVSREPLSAYFKWSMKFILFGHLPAVILVTYIPALSTALPNLILR